ncbi:transcription termination factor Rho [Mycolicibacillus trivialis]|uniref:Transcription termination factor Rho n=1 Tax=Mycolicibacillus trivialis TaxID=1798 RepID=A0A1X2EJQ3_9MYCO|nr:transcription termination factor Rho [Mycolicibacillus trivialis]ORX04510.1 transcription termination factor Rho [Mycolicibacillus trivialis]
MTETDLIKADDTTGSATSSEGSAARKSGGSLSTMVLAELRALAVESGVKGTSGMRKSDLIAAIRESRGQQNGGAAVDTTSTGDAAETKASPHSEQPAEDAGGARRERRAAARDTGPSAQADDGGDARGKNGADKGDSGKADAGRRDADKTDTEKGDSAKADADKSRAKDSDKRADDRDAQGKTQQGTQQGRSQDKSQQDRGDQSRDKGQDNKGQDNKGQDKDGESGQQGRDDDGEGRGGRRGRRFRDRRRRDRAGGDGADTELREDDVIQPVAGILDVLDNYAFVRTSGYLAGPNDVYVSMNMVRKNGLRRGDAVTGAVRAPREGEGGGQNSRQKFNPLVRLDSVNGGPVEDAKKRPEFGKLTPLYPNQRLRLETSTELLTTRVIDLIMPIGKGQRALIVSPPKAGKTTILQDIANAITRNNPECHLMVVLVDERPEEVTDMQRSVKGEVIASTFDRPPSDHTQAAELAIERAKRLVEQGKDVIVLLDSITRLGRAYNNASPASGRILSGGVDSTALYPPKRFLGAARNIEEGGSLTIIATAMVETGSTGDTVIFEEFKGTGNAELKLDRKIAERRVFPAVDVNPSGTRKDELLLSPDEFAIVHKLRRVLSGLDSHQAIDLLMSQLRKTKNNYEFLVQVSKNTPGGHDDD